MGYCDPADLYSFGLPRGALPNVGRLAGSASSTSDWIELDAHGFATDDELQFRAEAGGSLPSPLAEATTYYAILVDDWRFKVAASAGGAAIDLTTTGSRIVVVTPLPVAAAIRDATALIDDMLPAHVVPLESPYPEIVVITCAELAMWKLAQIQGAKTRGLTEIVDFAQKRLGRWGRGVPIRGTNAPDPANLSASATAPFVDTRGWQTYGRL